MKGEVEPQGNRISFKYYKFTNARLASVFVFLIISTATMKTKIIVCICAFGCPVRRVCFLLTFLWYHTATHVCVYLDKTIVTVKQILKFNTITYLSLLLSWKLKLTWVKLEICIKCQYLSLGNNLEFVATNQQKFMML